MRCQHYEALIALHVEGDLPPARAAEVEAHTTGCASCREFAEEIRATQAIWKQARQEEIDPAVYDAVRSRVMARLPARRQWGWIWAVPAAALACLLLFALAGTKPEPLLLRVMAPRPPAIQPSAPRPQPVRVAHRKRRIRPKTVATEAMTIKLLTDDPDVVIYWIVDKKGD